MSSIRQMRQRRSLTQLELAHQLGVTPSTIQNWERGRHRPSMKHLRRIAELFDIAVVDITLSEQTEEADLQRGET